MNTVYLMACLPFTTTIFAAAVVWKTLTYQMKYRLSSRAFITIRRYIATCNAEHAPLCGELNLLTMPFWKMKNTTQQVHTKWPQALLYFATDKKVNGFFCPGCEAMGSIVASPSCTAYQLGSLIAF